MALARSYPRSRRWVLSDVGCLCTFMDALPTRLHYPESYEWCCGKVPIIAKDQRFGVSTRDKCGKQIATRCHSSAPKGASFPLLPLGTGLLSESYPTPGGSKTG